MESWSVSQVCYWLLKNNMGELVDVFREEEIDGHAMFALNDRMIQQLVRKIGHQAILMDLLNKARQQIGVIPLPSCHGIHPPQLGGTVCSPAQPPIALTRKIKSYCKRPAPIIKDRRKIYFVAKRQQSVQRKRQASLFIRMDARAMAQVHRNENALVQRRMAKHKKNRKLVLARCSTQTWSMYNTPEFPEEVQSVLAEGQFPDHCIRIKIIETLQINMTKYLERSLYPTTQQYNEVIKSLIQLYPFLDHDGTGFLLWKRALRDRFKYVRRSIEDEQVLSHRFKFGRTKAYNMPPCRTVLLKEDEGYFIEIDAETALHVGWFEREYLKLEKDWEEVDTRMIRTLDVRRRMVNHGVPLKQILKMFPFLRSPNQLFREFQFLACTDVHKKTLQILEKHSEDILSLNSVRDHPVNVMLYDSMKQCTLVDVQKYLKMTATCLLLPVIFGEDFNEFAVLNGEVTVQTPILQVKNPFSFYAGEFSLYVGKEKLTQLDDCTMALAALLASFHIFNIPYSLGIETTLTALESMVFNRSNSLDVLENVKKKITPLQTPGTPGI